MLDTMRSMEASHPCVGDANPLVGEGVSVEGTLISSIVLSVDEVKKGMSSEKKKRLLPQIMSEYLVS